MVFNGSMQDFQSFGIGSNPFTRSNSTFNYVWESLAIRLIWNQENVGSNPTT